jgi:erythronate-4-phosphate dehydrogenase
MKIIADANIPFVKQAFADLGEVTTVAGRRLSPDDVRDAEILIVRSVTQVNRDLLENSKVRFVGTATIGTDHVDLDYLQQNHIGFASAPGSNAISASEYVISAILAMSRKQQFRVTDKTVGIIGCGNVGSRVLARLQALGVQCLVYDPPRALDFNDRDYVSWSEVIQADIVTAHVPLTCSGDYPTFQMFNSAFFHQLKAGAIFINTARGRAVEERALMTVLSAREDLQLVLDVWPTEPNINIQLLDKTAIATSHIAGYSLDGKVRGTQMIYHAVCQYFNRQPLWEIPPLPFANAYTAMQFDSSQSDADVIYQCVTNAYDILVDDANLRKIKSISPNQRGDYFDKLRKNYAVRREFANFEVIVTQERTELINALTGLGFKVETAASHLTS